MPKPVVTFQPELEDPEGNEVVLAFSNGAKEWPDYCGGLFRIRVLTTGDLESEIYGQSKREGKHLTVYVPDENLPGALVEAFFVSASGGVMLVINDTVVGFIDYSWFPPDFSTLLEVISKTDSGINSG